MGLSRKSEVACGYISDILKGQSHRWLSGEEVYVRMPASIKRTTVSGSISALVGIMHRQGHFHRRRRINDGPYEYRYRAGEEE